jgi:spermidine synthase
MNLFARWRMSKPADAADAVHVSEKFGVRSLHIGSDTIQSSMRIARPYDLELSYTRSMMAFLLFNERPQRVLMVGLGGGSLAKFIYHRLPWVTTEVVEVNPRVIAIARQYFHVPENDARFAVIIGNGAEHVVRDGRGADVIAVDGYDGESQAAELSAAAFYGACRKRLNAGGMLVVNLWGSDLKFDATLQRIETAFPAATLCLPAEKPGNIIVLAFRDAPGIPRWDGLAQRAQTLERLYGLEFPRFVQSLRKMNRHDERHLFL